MISAAAASHADVPCDQCALREQLLEPLQAYCEQARAGNVVDLLWIDAPPGLSAAALTETLATISEIRLHAVVTCVDDTNFLDDFSSDCTLAERQARLANAGDDSVIDPSQLSVLEMLADQIEGCDLLWCTGENPSPAVLDILHRLRPKLSITASIDALAARLEQAEPLFDPKRTFAEAGWQLACTSGDTATCFRSRRPFHPQRFHHLIEAWPAAVIRSYGTLWLASHNDLCLQLNQIGPSGYFLQLEGYWLATLERSEREGVLRQHPELRAQWDPQFGDRLTEISFVADEPLTVAWTEALESCVLSDFEMRLDWSRFEDPFPSFVPTGSEDDEANGDADPTENHASGRELRLVRLPESTTPR